MLDALAGHPVVHAIGDALIAFVWQGAIAGCVTAAVLMLLRRSAPQVRYVAGVCALATMAALPVVEFVQALPGGPTVTFEPVPNAPAAVASHDFSAGVVPGISSVRVGAPAGVSLTAIVVLAWTCGVVTLTISLLRSWRHVQRLRRRSTAAAAELARSVQALAARLGIARSVRVVESALVALPSVVGWLRPVIVLPASALAGLTPAQLEAIIAHELAHIRRGDYVVNALQCIVETLLFYHPAVWWVSRQIRLDRELCCDDLAAAACGDRALYARALTALEEQRTQVPSLAMAASGGDLVTRVRRLVEPSRPSGPGWSGGFVMSVMLTVVAVALTGSLSAGSRTDTSPAVAQERSTFVVTVRDQTGGVVPGATVGVTAPNGIDRRALTNATGNATVRDLPTGTYDVTVSMSGFKTSRLLGVRVVEGQTSSVAVILEIGALTEAVHIVGTRPAGAAATPPARGRTLPQSPGDLFDAAKAHYEAGRLADAERATARALELLREQTAARSAPTPLAPLSPAEPRLSAPIRVGGDIREPRQVSTVTPVYPSDAQAAGVHGTVIIEATIDREGRVIGARLLRSIPMLDAAALEAIRQWRYTPTLLNGVAVPVVMTVTVTFELR